jgi:hypothetical protein
MRYIQIPILDSYAYTFAQTFVTPLAFESKDASSSEDISKYMRDTLHHVYYLLCNPTALHALPTPEVVILLDNIQVVSIVPLRRMSNVDLGLK